MAETAMFRHGDKVIHPRRPEWGDGVVDSATNILHEGKPAQRLVVVFANHGRTTLNTAMAPLLAKEGIPSMSTASTTRNPFALRPEATPQDWPKANGGRPSTEELWKLPEALTDPFLSLGKRVQATLDTYRYNNDARTHQGARALLDWACAQTGLNDPLTKYTRHDLEQAFPRYARDRDDNLRQLVYQMRKQGRPEALEQLRQLPMVPAARTALERALRH